MKRKPTALLTGATGFIGSNLVRMLLDHHWRVHAIVRPQSHKKIIKSFGKSVIFHVVDGSIESIDRAVKKSHPDMVIHLASLFLAQHEPADIDPLFNSNLVFPTKLVESMTRHNVRNL